MAPWAYRRAWSQSTGALKGCEGPSGQASVTRVLGILIRTLRVRHGFVSSSQMSVLFTNEENKPGGADDL